MKLKLSVYSHADYVHRYAKPEDVAQLDNAHGGGAGSGGDEDMSEGDGSGDGYLSSSSEEEEEMVGKADP